MTTFDQLFESVEDSPQLLAEEVKFQIAHMIEDNMALSGMSKADLAEKLDCSRAYVTKALRGDNNFSILGLSKMAKALDAELTVALVPKAAMQHMQELFEDVIRHRAEKERKEAMIHAFSKAPANGNVFKLRECYDQNALSA